MSPKQRLATGHQLLALAGPEMGHGFIVHDDSRGLIAMKVLRRMTSGRPLAQVEVGVNAQPETVSQWVRDSRNKIMFVSRTGTTSRYRTQHTINDYHAAGRFLALELGARALPRFGGGVGKGRKYKQHCTAFGNMAAVNQGRLLVLGLPPVNISERYGDGAHKHTCFQICGLGCIAFCMLGGITFICE